MLFSLYTETDMSEEKNRYLKWNRLDNTAHLFPVIAREGMSGVYRVSVVLNEEIDEEILTESVQAVLPFFDAFRCQIKRGLFWYYFEENRRGAPRVVEEGRYPCLYMNPNSNRHYLFRISYYKNRINLEVFHVLADGSGAFNFLKELTYSYLRKAHPENAAIQGDIPDRETSFDSTDGYLQNYHGKEKSPYRTEKAVQIKGEKLPADQMSVVSGIVPADQLKKAAKQYGATINQYLVAAYAQAVYHSVLGSRPSDRPVNICVPVNLRPFFGSDTVRNFFAMVTAVFRPEHFGMTFEEILPVVRESLDRQLTKENLEKLFSYNVSNQTNLALRAVPLFLKQIVMRGVYKSSVKATTTTLTNLGRLSVAPEYEAYIDRFSVILAMSEYQNMKLSVISYRNTTTLTFSSCIRETLVQKEFFRQLVRDGINVRVETNGVCYE